MTYTYEQNGFRKDRSCQDHISSLYYILENRKLSKLDTYCCFVDFKKAFDSIPSELQCMCMCMCSCVYICVSVCRVVSHQIELVVCCWDHCVGVCGKEHGCWQWWAIVSVLLTWSGWRNIQCFHFVTNSLTLGNVYELPFFAMYKLIN